MSVLFNNNFIIFNFVERYLQLYVETRLQRSACEYGQKLICKIKAKDPQHKYTWYRKLM